MGGDDQLVVRLLGFRQPRRALGRVVGQGCQITGFQHLGRVARLHQRRRGIGDQRRQVADGGRDGGHVSHAASVSRTFDNETAASLRRGRMTAR